MTVPPVRFAAARGARLAYQAFGRGEHTIVAIPPLAQNIEVAWERPEIRAMLDRFASFCRYVQFDKRGTGASDRRSVVPGIDERVDDLRAVMDDAGVERAHLFGSSEGGPMALLFAATYPERVDSVILSGAGASEYPPEMSAAEVEAQRDLHARFAAVWGTPRSPVAAGFAPSLAADPTFIAWHQRYERLSADRDSLLDLLELTLEMDVREVLPHLEVPVLVLHRTDDPVIPVERGREVAEAVPDGRFVELPGADHFEYAGDVEAWMVEVERWVTGRVAPRSGPSRPAPPRPVTPRPRTVHVVTLGRFAVELDGDPVPTSAWGSRQARTLVKRLVAARGWPVTRDHLIDLLWPDEHDRRRLGARLSVQLSGVRRVLGGGVVADRETVRLDLDAVSTDLETLHGAADDAAVVTAYTGEFLPEDRYDDWTAGPRDEARDRFVASARRLLADAAAAGRTSRAVDLARRLLEADPYDDDAHRRLVEVLAAAGRVGEARRAHEAWARAVADLGVGAVPPLTVLTG